MKIKDRLIEEQGRDYLADDRLTDRGEPDTFGEMQDIQETVNRLRNRNVAQLLDDLGEQPPCIVRSIKRQFTRMASDIIQEIHDDQDDQFSR